MKINTVFIVISIFFAFGVLTTSLVSASTPYSLGTLPSVPTIRFSGGVMPGHILYPFRVAREKIYIVFAPGASKCLQRVGIAGQRLQAARELLQLEHTSLAFKTLLKGHQYLAESVYQFQEEKLDSSLKVSLHDALESYRTTVIEKKPQFSEKEQAVLDKLLAENEALQTHLGN